MNSERAAAWLCLVLGLVILAPVVGWLLGMGWRFFRIAAGW